MRSIRLLYSKPSQCKSEWPQMVVVVTRDNEIHYIFRFEDLFPATPYTNLTEELIKEKLQLSDAYAEYPLAKITNGFISKIQTQFYQKVFKSRIDILYDLCKASYSEHNINRYAVVDLATIKKIGYFLKTDRDRVITETIKRFKQSLNKKKICPK